MSPWVEDYETQPIMGGSIKGLIIIINSNKKILQKKKLSERRHLPLLNRAGNVLRLVDGVGGNTQREGQGQLPRASIVGLNDFRQRLSAETLVTGFQRREKVSPQFITKSSTRSPSREKRAGSSKTIADGKQSQSSIKRS